LFRIRLLSGLLVLCLTAGCRAQSAPQKGTNPELDRRIEIAVRSQYQLSPDVNVSIGAREPSQFSGYETLPVTLTEGEKTQVVDLLISADNTKLAHLDTFDLTKNPDDFIDITGRPIRGNPAAKVTVINFDDLECPFCARMHEELFPATMEHYKNLVRYIYIDFPLTSLHPWAMHAAVDANCLAAQSGQVYWTYVDYLHAHGQEIMGQDHDAAKSFAALDRIARQEATLGRLDQTILDACLAKQDETVVQASTELAAKLGIEGTPQVYVNGERVNSGAVSQNELWIVIDRALRAEGEQPPATPLAAAASPDAAGQSGPSK
jgi:protein-disulfide isomerase